MEANYEILEASNTLQNVIISEHPIEFENKELVVCGEKLQVGDYSDLHGFYTEKLRYCGYYKDNYYAFFLGKENKVDIFTSERYVYDMIIVLPTRDDQILLSHRRHIIQQIYNKKQKQWK